MFKRVLIANRGEIAVRIIRACRSIGISPVAVYSEADASALHVRLADDAVLLGPPEAAESYLLMDKLIDAAKSTGCEAVHPGYGFLAERAEFASAVIEAGLVWIGPPPEAIDLLGDKVRSRIAMENAGIPVTPGFSSDDADIKTLLKEADRITYPLLIKAAAGGGGKGMRVVNEPLQLEEAVEGAMREAKGAFGDSRVFLEKWVEEPRHIEFQIFADSHGNVIHLFERECSIQRRHQKVVEETPSVAVTPELRKEMGDAAILIAKTANYVNAGTVEFLLDKNGNFFFLEVNTRIQVEHPVTEEVVGVDLVVEQFRIAAGEPLQWKQSELTQRGHAIEVRIYAEDPASGFLPAAGPLLHLEEPRGPGIRVESGVVQGVEVPIYYDPIMSKIIAWGSDREMSRKRLVDALEHTVILGVPTTAPFLRDVLKSKSFIDGDTRTDFIERNFSEWTGEDETELKIALAAATALPEKVFGAVGEDAKHRLPSPWETIGSWRIGANS
ncbi:MAG: acetyl-CoA carboxylase biotin carboxylase subunit [Candidatus Electryonea clarkiae]|nr:acetyl-CoA carboxylase biotin carboxylase subunit [Candidatus Electryonea clarkiae]MDP8286797.1 acetyl-CoA carboxylase biotin carboxylase subunit [Candidatus Electryonea clarkiae]